MGKKTCYLIKSGNPSSNLHHPHFFFLNAFFSHILHSDCFPSFHHFHRFLLSDLPLSLDSPHPPPSSFKEHAFQGHQPYIYQTTIKPGTYYNIKAGRGNPVTGKEISKRIRDRPLLPLLRISHHEHEAT